MSHSMTWLFADAANPNANMFLIVIIALASVGANIATIGMWMNSRKKQETVISPQPFLVAMEKEFTKLHVFEDAMKENKREHENIFSKIGGVERGSASRLEQQLTSMREESRKDRGELHDKINEARESVAGLEATTQLQNQQLASMATDIKRILERGRS